MEFYLNLFLLLMLQAFEGSIKNIFAAAFMECSPHQLNFQKIVGVSPPAEYFTTNSLIYSQSRSENSSMPINYKCWDICAKDNDCMSYILLINSNSCYGFTYFENTRRYNYLPKNIKFIIQPNAIYFEKSCLKVPDSCKNKLWAITRIPGSKLVSQGMKKLPTLVTRSQCAEQCIFETEFLCVSASFIPSFKNNYARLEGRGGKFKENVGECFLSERDKTIQPDAFRASTYDEEYIENECYDRPIENLQCSFELYPETAFSYAEILFKDLSQRECQKKCLQESRFYCQGVTFVGNSTQSECFLHSEDIISMGPRSRIPQPFSIYMRRVRCLNISVMCNKDEMIVKYQPQDWFRGKLYTNSHSEECSVLGNGTSATVLKLPIGDEVKESRCGVLRAYDMKGPIQRIFITTHLVFQPNLNVQTQSDRLIKVGCILTNITKQNEIPENVSQETALAFTQTKNPNETFFYSTLPKFEVKTIDVSKDYETNDVRIGQNIEIQIIVNSLSKKYDVQIRSLIAYSNESGAIELIDANGCPTDPNIFPGFEMEENGNQKILKGRFHAFKFVGTPDVDWNGKVRFCMYKCDKLNCTNQTILNDTNRRTKRAENITLNVGSNNAATTKIKSTIDVQTSDKTIPFSGPPNYVTIQDGSKFFQNGSLIDSNQSANIEIPLKLKLHVRGPYYGETDTLMCGENNKVLVAGFDFKNPDEWCVNYSLLIAIIIFLLVIQIIFIACCCYFIKRYKRLIAAYKDNGDEYPDFVDGRKVHWADQGTMSEFSASHVNTY